MNKKQILQNIKLLSRNKEYKLISYSPEYEPTQYICGFSTARFKIIYVKDLIFGRYLEHLNVLNKDKINFSKFSNFLNISLKYKMYTILLNDCFIFTGRYRGQVFLPKKYKEYADEKYNNLGSGVNNNFGLIFEDNDEYIVVAEHLIQVFDKISKIKK